MTYFDEIESLGEHDDTAGVGLPDETPKIGNRPLVGSLSHHIGIWFEYTLRVVKCSSVLITFQTFEML